MKVVIYRENTKFRMLRELDWQEKLQYKNSYAVINSAKVCDIPARNWRAMQHCQHNYTVQLYLKEVWNEGYVYQH